LELEVFIKFQVLESDALADPTYRRPEIKDGILK
jgi:hypothetical protein